MSSAGIMILVGVQIVSQIRHTSHRPARYAGKFDMNMFYWIIIELIY